MRMPLTVLNGPSIPGNFSLVGIRQPEGRLPLVPLLLVIIQTHHVSFLSTHTCRKNGLGKELGLNCMILNLTLVLNLTLAKLCDLDFSFLISLILKRSGWKRLLLQLVGEFNDITFVKIFSNPAQVRSLRNVTMRSFLLRVLLWMEFNSLLRDY